MAETVVENGVADDAKADDCDAESSAESVHSAVDDEAELDSNQAVDGSTSSHQSKDLTNVTTTPIDLPEVDCGDSELTQEASLQQVVSAPHSTAG